MAAWRTSIAKTPTARREDKEAQAGEQRTRANGMCPREGQGQRQGQGQKQGQRDQRGAEEGEGEDRGLRKRPGRRRKNRRWWNERLRPRNRACGDGQVPRRYVQTLPTVLLRKAGVRVGTLTRLAASIATRCTRPTPWWRAGLHRRDPHAQGGGAAAARPPARTVASPIQDFRAESAVQLHKNDAFDLDVTLAARADVHFQPQDREGDGKGELKVRLRFESEVWDMVLSATPRSASTWSSATRRASTTAPTTSRATPGTVPVPRRDGIEGERLPHPQSRS